MQELLRSELEPTRRPRRTFTKQFKADLVNQVALGHESIAKIARDHDINANLLHKWVNATRASTERNKMVPVNILAKPKPNKDAPSFELSLEYGTFRFSQCWDPAAVALLIKSLA